LAEFIVNEPIKTEDDTIEVTVTPRNPLRPGRHRFRLIVVDDSGNESEPDEVEVVVLDQERPTAVLRAPPQVSFGTSFRLDGSASVDVGGGRIVAYLWTYLGVASL
jgi:hypothetical protein